MLWSRGNEEVFVTEMNNPRRGYFVTFKVRLLSDILLIMQLMLHKCSRSEPENPRCQKCYETHEMNEIQIERVDLE